MIELISILGLAGLGVFLIFWAADDIVNDFLERAVGIYLNKVAKVLEARNG